MPFSRGGRYTLYNPEGFDAAAAKLVQLGVSDFDSCSFSEWNHMIEYTNRRGEVYYLLQGKTKTGKTKYYASKKQDGIPAETLPPDFQFYEHPERGLVTVRKVKHSRVLPAEKELLTAAGRRMGIQNFLSLLNGASRAALTTGGR